jgi:hypothetical protein
MVDRDALATVELKQLSITRRDADEVSVDVAVLRRVCLTLLCSRLVLLSHPLGLLQRLALVCRRQILCFTKIRLHESTRLELDHICVVGHLATAFKHHNKMRCQALQRCVPQDGRARNHARRETGVFAIVVMSSQFEDLVPSSHELTARNHDGDQSTEGSKQRSGTAAQVL